MGEAYTLKCSHCDFHTNVFVGTLDCPECASGKLTASFYMDWD